jgi:predicted DNA-binding WGR domain protein
MIRLECTTGGHHKFYELDLVSTNNRHIVRGYSGRIGQAPVAHIIYDGDRLDQAQTELDKKQREKLKKGYVVTQNSKPVSAPAEKKRLTCR